MHSDSQEIVTIDHERGIQIVVDTKNPPLYSSLQYKSAFEPIKIEKKSRKTDYYGNNNAISVPFISNERKASKSKQTEDESGRFIKKTTCNPLHLLTVGMHTFHEYIIRKSKSNEEDSLEIDIDSDEESRSRVELDFSSSWSLMLKKLNSNLFPVSISFLKHSVADHASSISIGKTDR